MASLVSYGRSLTSHVLHKGRKEGPGHVANIELSPQSNVAVTNEICTLHKVHLLSRSSNYVATCLANVNILLSNHVVQCCFLQCCFLGQQLTNCSILMNSIGKSEHDRRAKS